MQIIIKDQALTKTLEEIADAYRAICPSEYTAFLGLVNSASKSLKRPNGMSDEGHFLDLMRFPGRLYPFIKQQMRKRHGIDDFFADKKNYRLVAKVWSEIQTRRKATSVFRVKPSDFSPPETPAALN
jgi:hypothetical protein